MSSNTTGRIAMPGLLMSRRWVSKSFYLFSMVFGLWWLSFSAQANQLTDLKFSALPGDQVELTLKFDGAPPQMKSYTTDQPARIALDLLGVTNGLTEKHFVVGNGNARAVTVVQTKDRTRVIIELVELAHYTARTDGHQLMITVSRNPSTSASPAMTADKNNPITSVVARTADRVQDIDFRRGDQGAGLVILKLSNPATSIDVHEENGRIQVELLNAKIADRLQRRLDVSDFDTPVRTVDAMNQDKKSIITIKPEGRYEYMAYQTNNLFTVSVKPITEEELNRRNKEKFVYTGEKLSLNFQDIEVRAVLQLIADFIGVNLVASDTVSGKVSLRLKEVPWDQALDLVLKAKGLDKRKVGNVLLVAPVNEIAAQEKAELESNRQSQELSPLKTEFIQVNYAKAKDLAGLLGGKEGASVLSSRGNVSVDERTNTMLIHDTAASIEQIHRVIAKLDVPVRQVLIEARIVVANTDVGKALGVRWGGSGYHFGDHNSKLFSAGGSIESVSEQANGLGVVGKDGSLLQDSGNQLTFGLLKKDASSEPKGFSVTSPQHLAVDLGVADSRASSIAFGLTSLSSGLLQLELSALETSGSADIIATPKVLTADQQTATIASGTKIPYAEKTSSGAASIAFKDAVLSLEVTPQITPDGRVIMQLKVNQDSIGKIFSEIPSIDTNALSTRILVENGETVVLGGVFRNQVVTSVAKTPFFGDLPFIGRFFRTNSESQEKQELLIFVTPNIVQDALKQS